MLRVISFGHVSRSDNSEMQLTWLYSLYSGSKMKYTNDLLLSASPGFLENFILSSS